MDECTGGDAGHAIGGRKRFRWKLDPVRARFCRGHRLWIDHRPVASRALAEGMGPQRASNYSAMCSRHLKFR